MALSCHIKKLQHKTLLRWQFGLVYNTFITLMRKYICKVLLEGSIDVCI